MTNWARRRQLACWRLLTRKEIPDMRQFKRLIGLTLSLLLVLAVLPIQVIAAANPVEGTLYRTTPRNFIYSSEKESEKYEYVSANHNLYNDLPRTTTGFYNFFNFLHDISTNYPQYMIGDEIVITQPALVEKENESYRCIGVTTVSSTKKDGGTDSKIPDELNDGQIHKFENGQVSWTLTSDEFKTGSTGSGVYLYVNFIWQKVTSFDVTYDFSGPEGTTVYPVFAKFKGGDSNGSGEAPYSLGYFTVAQSEDNLNLIKSDSDVPFTLAYDAPTGQGVHNPKPEDKAKAIKIENNKLVVKAVEGDKVFLPKLAQHRNLAVLETSQVFYPVVSFVAVGTGGTRYAFNGWKVGDSVSVEVADLYGKYTPSAATTLKADWKEITLTETAAESIPEVPLLSVYNEVGGVPVKLQQKTTGSAFGFESVTTDATGALTYEVSMKFSDLFSSSDMPWRSGSAYFKSVNNENFADIKINVKLDDHLVPAADKEGYTTITVSNASLKITGVEVDGPLEDDEVQEGDNTHTIKAKLNDAKKFTIDLDWDKYSGSEMKVEIPTKVVEGYSGEITGTTVTVTGKMDFSNAHTAEQSDGNKADFTADEFVRYLLAYDTTWFNKYGGEDMTLTQMLQAAKDVQTKLNEFNLTSNTLIATASEKVTGLTLDKTEVTVNVNETATVTATITPDTVTNKAVTWSVEEGKDDIVKVENGVITGLKPGTATVTCASVYDPTKTAQVTVTVNGIVYVEPSTGGTVALSGEGVTQLLDNVYSVKQGSTVTITVTPDGSNVMAGEKPSVYHGENTSVTVDGSGTTFTFTLPDASPVYVSAVFVIKNASGNTVIDDPKTVTDGNNQGYTDVDKVDVEMSADAVSEMLGHVTEDGAGQYSADKLEQALNSESITHNDGVYRHIQTQTKISVTSADLSVEIGLRKIELNIDFQYRVVASNQADPDAIETKSGSSQNAVAIKPSGSDDEGWITFDSKAPTYIVVPMPTTMGNPGDWIKATHTHQGRELPSQYLQIQSDGTVTYINTHEGFSPFTFEQLKCVKNIQIDNSGDIANVENFTPATSTYNISVGSDVESLNLIPELTVSGTTGLTVTFGGEEVANTGAGSAISYRIDLVNNSVNTVKIEYNGQTYTVNITRGTPPTPPEPSTYPTTVTQPEHGAVTASPAYAVTGGKVTLTVKPDDGYVLDTLTVTDSTGKAVTVTDNGDGTYTFTMPQGGVTVKATFKLKKCDGGADCPSRKFPDLDPKSWYHEYTDYVITHSLMNGNNLGLFDPDGTVTRATVVMTLWNYENRPVVNYAMQFTDVKEGQWYTEAIRWAASEGIVGGYGDGTFQPDKPVNREELAKILYGYEQKYGNGGFKGAWMFPLAFADSAKVSSWAYESVAWCTMNGVITGKPGNLFDPAGSAKRTDLAAMLTRYFQLAEDAE